jgi:hypothetical protein
MKIIELRKNWAISLICMKNGLGQLGLVPDQLFDIDLN